MLHRSGILVAISLLPAIVALVGLGVSPAVTFGPGRDAEMVYLLHAWFGMPTLVAGCRTGAERRVHPGLLVVMPVGAIVAGVAGVALWTGAGAGWLPPAIPALAVFVGLAVAEGAAIVAIVAGTSLRGRTMRVVRAAAVAGGIFSALLLMATTMQPLEDPFTSPFRAPGTLLAMVAMPTVWAVLATVSMDRLDRMPEFGGVIHRPPVAFTCPRCGCDQRQADAAGCRRCGLDVRIERQ